MKLICRSYGVPLDEAGELVGLEVNDLAALGGWGLGIQASLQAGRFAFGALCILILGLYFGLS